MTDRTRVVHPDRVRLVSEPDFHDKPYRAVPAEAGRNPPCVVCTARRGDLLEAVEAGGDMPGPLAPADFMVDARWVCLEHFDQFVPSGSTLQSELVRRLVAGRLDPQAPNYRAP